jgi:cytochrome c oxidase subunit 3
MTVSVPDPQPSRPGDVDVSSLPQHAFGERSVVWWGALLLVAIEGTMMSLLLVSYFYVRGNYDLWPPSPYGSPVFRLALPLALALVFSLVPTRLAQQAARAERLRPARFYFLLATLPGVAALVLRAFEFRWLPFRWDAHAYGSLFWMILGLHTLHIISGVAENAVVLAVLYLGPVERKHFGDLESSALLWYLVVLEWIPAFAILYLEPILLPR